MNLRVKGAYRSTLANPRMFISVYAFDNLQADEPLNLAAPGTTVNYPNYVTSGPVSAPGSGTVWRKIHVESYEYSIRISGFPQGKPLYETPL
jgi:hypothetical protein